jgi:hypothetical protein
MAVDRGAFLRRHCSGGYDGPHWLDCTRSVGILVFLCDTRLLLGYFLWCGVSAGDTPRFMGSFLKAAGPLTLKRFAVK